MTGTDNILDKIIIEFPDLKIRITALYIESNNFIEVCEDYVICLESIKKLESMNKLEKQKEIIDLKQAMAELREELLSNI
jgi:hypothetical protein